MSEITPEYIAHLRELDKKASVSSASSDEVYLHIHAATTALPSLLDEIERLWSRLTDAANADGETTWCEDKINDDDIEYVLKSSAEAAEARVYELRNILNLLLDQIDYTSGACRMNEMVGAVLGKNLLEAAHRILKGGEG